MYLLLIKSTLPQYYVVSTRRSFAAKQEWRLADCTFLSAEIQDTVFVDRFRLRMLLSHHLSAITLPMKSLLQTWIWQPHRSMV